MGRGLLVERTGRQHRREVAVEHLLHGLADVQRIETCIFGKPSRKMMRSTNLSACSISSIDSLGHCLASAL